MATIRYILVNAILLEWLILDHFLGADLNRLKGADLNVMLFRLNIEVVMLIFFLYNFTHLAFYFFVGKRLLDDTLVAEFDIQSLQQDLLANLKIFFHLCQFINKCLVLKF